MQHVRKQENSPLETMENKDEAGALLTAIANKAGISASEEVMRYYGDFDGDGELEIAAIVRKQSGGEELYVADAENDQAQIYACDLDGSRLNKMAARMNAALSENEREFHVDGNTITYRINLTNHGEAYRGTVMYQNDGSFDFTVEEYSQEFNFG